MEVHFTYSTSQSPDNSCWHIHIKICWQICSMKPFIDVFLFLSLSILFGPALTGITSITATRFKSTAQGYSGYFLIFLLHALFGTINLPPLISSSVGSVSPINKLQKGIIGVFLLAARNLSWIIS